MAGNKLNASLVLDTTPFERSIRRASISLDRLGKQLQNTGNALTQGLTIPIAGMGAAALKAFSDMEKLEKGLSAVMGGSEAAAVELENLKEAARAPGLGFEEAVRGSIRLQAVGLSADEARGTLQAFGAAIAATGGTAQNLDAVQYQLTQMISKNRILQEDFGILQENVPLLGKAVENAFGTANIERIRATGISAQEFNRRLTEALAALPETQAATGGLGNAFDNLQDELKFSFAELGRTIAASIDLEGIMIKVSNAVSRAVEFFKNLSPETQKIVVAVAALVAGLGPLLIGLGSFIQLSSFAVGGIGKLAAAFSFLTGPIGLVVGAIGLVTLAFVTANRAIDANLEARNKLLDVDRRAKESIIAEKTQVERLVAVIRDENTSREEKIKALNLLKQINPQYFGSISTEKDLVIQASDAYAKFSKNLLITAKLKAAEESLVDLEKQLLNVTEASEPTVLQKLGAAVRAGAQSFGNFNFVVGNYARNIGGVFGTNIKNNTQSINAQTEALRKYITELEKSLNTQDKATRTGGGGGGGGGISIPTIGQATSPAINLQGIKNIADKAQSSVNSVRSSLADLGTATPLINQQKEALLAYENGLAEINKQISVFGGDELTQQLQFTQSALQNAISNFDLDSEAVTILTEKYLALADAARRAAERQALLAEYERITSAGFAVGAEVIGQYGLSIQSVLKAVARAALQSAAEFARASVIKAISAWIADSFGKLGILGAAVAAAGGAIVGGIFQAAISKIQAPRLAEGGFVTGETLAVIGDNPSGKEAVIPFERMGEFLNMFGGGDGYIAEARISGEDLLLLVNRAEKRTSRIR